MNLEATPLPPDLGPLRAQDTLEPLMLDGDRLVTVSGRQTYPVREGLVFMGYPASDEALITVTMEEERRWQGTPDRVQLDEEFLDVSAPEAVALIRLLKDMMRDAPRPKALELGSGSGWVTWLLDRAGFDAWMVDFEANSLYSGWVYDSETLAPGRRVVADARYAPFADASFDVVVLKEFAHHVENTEQLFAEVNRVLKPGGLVALLEPTMCAWKLVYQLRHPEGHEGHRIKFPNRYLRQLERQGFRRRRLSYVYHRLPGRAIPRWLQGRARRNVAAMRDNRSVFTTLHFRLLGGGSMVYIGQKVRTIEPPSRPAFRQIPTSRLTLTARDREAWRGCRDRVARAAEQVL